MSSLNFNSIALCRSFAKPQSNGCLFVSGGDVQWQVSIAQGRLHCAVHSAQTLETLEYHALRLNLDAAVQKLRSLTQGELNRLSQSPQGFSWVVTLMDRMVQQQVLTETERARLSMTLSEDALESMLWLTEGISRWEPETGSETQPPMRLSALPELASLLPSLEQRLQAWQQLRPLIRSPYEQPYCLNAGLLKQTIPGGMLSQEILAMLVQLMQNASIRKLSMFLKQDDLRVAQLLHPYLQYRVLALKPAAAPYQSLPQIPSLKSSAPGRGLYPPHTAASARTAPADLRETHTRAARGAHLSGTPPAGAHSSGVHSSGTHSSAAGKTHKIVCIDDSPAMLNTIRQYLGHEQFDVVTVENPMESLTALFGMKPDLILMDVSMPGINGNRLCQILRRSDVFKQLPIIMVSGNTGTLDKAKAQASGATDYLTKPFSREELLAIVQTHLIGTPAPS